MTVASQTDSDAPLSRLIRRLRLHSPLSEADAVAIAKLPYTLKVACQNSHLVWEGDHTRHCLVLVSGYAHRFRVTDLGLRQLLAIYLPGDPIDFDHLFLPTADDGLQAIKRSEFALIRHEDLRGLMAKRPTVADAIIRSMLVDSSIFREWTVNVGRRDARARISHLLCEISARLQAQGFDFANVPLPLTQEQIADATGLTPVHVNRTLRSLSRDGAIQRRGGLVMLPDPTMLHQIAGFDPRYLHLGS